MYHANVNVNWQCECKKLHVKDYIWNPATCSWEYDKHFASIIDNSVITCNEIIDAKSKSWDEETKTVPTNFNEKKCNLKNKKSLYITCFFLLITITLLISVSICCYMITYRVKQKHLLSY